MKLKRNPYEEELARPPAVSAGVLAMVQRSRLGETLGRERMFFSLQLAVEKWELMHDSGQGGERQRQAQA